MFSISKQLHDFPGAEITNKQLAWCELPGKHTATDAALLEQRVFTSRVDVVAGHCTYPPKTPS